MESCTLRVKEVVGVRMADLSRRSGVPVATVKFYLREGLLPPGEATSPNQAQYGEEHVARLALVRALVDVGRLPLTSVRQVLAAVDSPPPLLHDLLGVAHDALPPQAPADVDTAELVPVLEALGWDADDCAGTALRQLAVAAAAARSAGLDAGTEVLVGYGRALGPLAELELATIPADPPEAAVAAVVLGTVVYEPVILAMRRLAHQQASARRTATAGARAGAARAASAAHDVGDPGATG